MVLLGDVVEERDDGITVFVPFPHDKKKPEGYQSVVGVELVDKRHISADQRKKAYVLISYIAAWWGYTPLEAMFQSTRPVRGATSVISPSISAIVVSIHAPRAGRDV